MRIREKLRSWLGVLIVAIQAICGVWIGRIDDVTWKNVLTWVVIICAAFNAFFTIWQGEAVKTAKERSQTLLSCSFGPMLEQLISGFHSSRLTKEGLAALITQVEGIAEQDVGLEKCRVSVFEVCDGSGPDARLEPKRGTDLGRNERSTSIFRKNDGEGQEVWKRLTDEGISECRDIKKRKLLPPFWDDSKKRKYRSFVSVSIDDGKKMYGMLTINSEKPNAFDKGDKDELKVLAQVIALGMHLSDIGEQKYYLLKRGENSNG